MRLTMIGCNHKTADIAMREQLAFSPEQVAVTLQKWAEQFAANEAVLLATCNRTELYVASENGDIAAADSICRFLSEEKNLREEQLQSTLQQLHDEEVVSHLFNVAGSLDSMVVGEPQILAQVKSAYQLASDVGTTGPILHGMFQASLKTAKRIVTETEIHQRRVSIPSVAVVDFAMQVFERLDDKKTLVLGAGEMAEETLHYLVDYGAASITVVNRNRERAERLAGQWDAQTDVWDNRIQHFADADVVVGATGSTEPIVRLDDYLAVEPQRNGRPLFMLDLAMPRDFDPAIGQRDNVYLYAIDDLKAACEHNRASRSRELPKAEKIIKHEVDRFRHEMRRRATGSIIRQLRTGWDEIKEAELKRLFNKVPNLTESEQAEVRYAFDRLINKLLHPPLESLRDEAKQGVPGMLLDAVSRLFRLKD